MTCSLCGNDSFSLAEGYMLCNFCGTRSSGYTAEGFDDDHGSSGTRLPLHSTLPSLSKERVLKTEDELIIDCQIILESLQEILIAQLAVVTLGQSDKFVSLARRLCKRIWFGLLNFWVASNWSPPLLYIPGWNQYKDLGLFYESGGYFTPNPGCISVYTPLAIINLTCITLRFPVSPWTLISLAKSCQLPYWNLFSSLSQRTQSLITSRNIPCNFLQPKTVASTTSFMRICTHIYTKLEQSQLSLIDPNTMSNPSLVSFLLSQQFACCPALQTLTGQFAQVCFNSNKYVNSEFNCNNLYQFTIACVVFVIMINYDLVYGISYSQSSMYTRSGVISPATWIARLRKSLLDSPNSKSWNQVYLESALSNEVSNPRHELQKRYTPFAPVGLRFYEKLDPSGSIERRDRFPKVGHVNASNLFDSILQARPWESFRVPSLGVDSIPPPYCQEIFLRAKQITNVNSPAILRALRHITKTLQVY